MRFAVVGAGTVARQHLRAMVALQRQAAAPLENCSVPAHDTEALEHGTPLAGAGAAKAVPAVTAVVDTDRGAAEALAAEVTEQQVGLPGHRVEVYDSVDSALQATSEAGGVPAGGDDRLFDAALVAVPHDVHEPVATAVLQAGRHLLLEKPMAPTLEECGRILEAARVAREASGAVFAVAENAQYWPDVLLARQLLRDGAIGELVTARAHYYEALATSPFESSDASADEDSSWLSWRASLKRCGGGIVLDGGQHWLRPLRMWLGEVDSVVATLGRPLAVMEGESLAHALLRFKSGIVAEYSAMVLPHTAHPAHNVAPWFRLTGTHGEILIGGEFEGGVTLFDAESPQGRVVLAPGHGSPCGFLDAFVPQMDEFCQAVAGSAELSAAPEYALGELRVALAIYQSARERALGRRRVDGPRARVGR